MHFLTGGKSFYEMELFAQAHKTWLKRVVGMVSVSSHDTFNRIFQAIKPEHFVEFLARTTDRIRKNISGEIVAFDGKTHRGTGDGLDSALHMINAWVVKNRLVLGQLPVPDKSNEILVIPQLMDILELKDYVITADALNCQKAIAGKAHGRLECRKFLVSDDINWLEASHEWAGLKSICVVEAVREVVKGAESATTRRYYISSLGQPGQNHLILP